MPNISSEQIIIHAERTSETEGGIIISGSRVSLILPSEPLRYLYSGWQSWSLTSWVDISHPVRPLRPISQRPRVADPDYVDESRPNGSWYGAVEIDDGRVIFVGSLGLESHVLLEDRSLVGWYETGSGDWFFAIGDEIDIMTRYAELLGERFAATKKNSSFSPISVVGNITSPIRVWCSWYSLYTLISEVNLLKILSDLDSTSSGRRLPFDVFQIDDGWQAGIGNWEPNDKFPSGMKNMASCIHSSGRKPGLWLAPLLIVPSSSIFREHSDWLLHEENGGLVSAGFNWGEPLYALDTTHPAALEWLAALMVNIRAWGFEYAKLDFLYAGALPGKRHVDMPRENAFRNGLSTIREALGDTYLLTCGTPILPSLGLCDGIRIGPDIAGYFTSPIGDTLLMNFAFPGARNVLRTSLNRLWLKQLIHIDPDVVYFTSRQNSLSPEQRSLLQDMAHICNFKASSDIPSWLTEPENRSLREFLETTPEILRVGRTSFQIGDRQVEFGLHMGMPAMPNRITNILGEIISRLADVPVIMKLFENISKIAVDRMLGKYPV